MQHDREDHVRLLFIFRRNRAIRRLVPVWARGEEKKHLHRYYIIYYSYIYTDADLK